MGFNVPSWDSVYQPPDIVIKIKYRLTPGTKEEPALSRRHKGLDGPSPGFAGEWGSFGPYPWIWAAPFPALLHLSPSPGSPIPPPPLGCQFMDKNTSCSKIQKPK